MFCCMLLYVNSRFANFLTGKRERAGCFVFCIFVFLVSYDCSVALPHGAIGLSAVFDCGIFWSY